jgi:hypothetical protein
MQSLATTKKKGFKIQENKKKKVTTSNITCNGVMFIV